MADSEAFGGNGGLIAVDPATGRQTSVSQGGLFRDPADVAVLHDGTLVVSDLVAFDGTGGLIGVDPSDGRQTKIAASDVFLGPLGVAVDANGQVVVAYTQRAHAAGAVMRVNPVNGEHHAVAPEFAFFFPGFVALDAVGDVIVAEPDIAGAESRLERIDAAGQVFVLTVNRPVGAIYGGVVVEPGGAILLANLPSHSPEGLLRVDPLSGVPTTVSQVDKLVGGPFGIALEASGNIVAITRVHGVVRIDPTTGAQSVVTEGNLFSDVGPTGIAVAR